MPIPLYISPTTPLPGPADFAGILQRVFDAKDRRDQANKQNEIERQRMSMTASENAKDRSQRASERKDTNAYNQGMLELYRGDRKSAEVQRMQQAEDKANQEYLVAYMKQDEAGMELARQKIEQLKKKQAQAAAAPGQKPEPPPGLGVPLGASRLF